MKDDRLRGIQWNDRHFIEKRAPRDVDVDLRSLLKAPAETLPSLGEDWPSSTSAHCKS